MLTAEQNELLTRTDAGTPGGEYMRRYWLPALLSEELPEPDGEPVRVQLLGERLVAFRDTAGHVGLLEEFCPHRRASLWLGRNEEHGLRCVYHGWKFDVDGRCVDQMNEPESMQFCSKIHITAYPTVEMGGIVWAYLGPREKMPPPPKFEWTQVAETHRHVTKTWEECNWLQALEGGLDTSHAPIMHRKLRPDVEAAGISPAAYFVKGKAPIVEVDTSDYGYMYGGIRELGEDRMFVRTYHYVMPFTQIRASQYLNGPEFRPKISGHYWVPMDDENCMVYNWVYSYGDEPLNDEDKEDAAAGPQNVYVDQGYRKRRNKDNSWLIDRQAQKTQTFTGIVGINTQDHAVQESMGPIVDRSKEHLGPADKAIIALRQLLLRGVKTVQEGGDPPGTGESYYWLRAIERVLPAGTDWRAALADEIYEQAMPVGVNG